MELFSFLSSGSWRRTTAGRPVLVSPGCVDVGNHFPVAVYLVVAGKPDVDSETSSVKSKVSQGSVASSWSVLGPSVSSRTKLAVLGNEVPRLKRRGFRVVVYLQGAEVLVGL